jgi:putative inorganic carbon (hco3(-)) transporter
MTGATLPNIAFSLFVLITSLTTALVLAVLADTPMPWVVLLLLGFATITGIMVWLPDLKTPLVALFAFTLPMDISKALTSEASAYSPALSLFVSDLAFLPLLALWLFDRILVTRSWPVWTGIHRIALVQCAWLLFEAWASHASASYFLFLNNLKCLLYFLMLADMARDPRVLRAALLGFLAGLAAQLMMAVLQFITGSDLRIPGTKNTDIGRELVFEEAGGLHFRRLSGFLPHPNVFSDYLTFVLPPILTVLLLGRRALGGAWIPLLALGFGGLAALTMALSRAGWISFVFAMAFVLFGGWRSGLVRPRQLATVGLCAVFVLGVIAVVFPAAIYRITNSDQMSSAARLAMIDQAALIIKENPIVGVGLGGYNKAAQTTRPTSFAALLPDFRATLLKGVVHNKYLLTFAELGIVGLILFLWFLLPPIWLPFANIQWSSPFQYALVLGLSGSVVAQTVFYMFDHFSYDVRLSMLYVTAGLLVATASSGSLRLEAGRQSNNRTRALVSLRGSPIQDIAPTPHLP